jgi:hypothetical protein
MFGAIQHPIYFFLMLSTLPHFVKFEKGKCDFQFAVCCIRFSIRFLRVVFAK